MRARLHRFARDRRGNVAALFGLALLPLIGLFGAAIDYSRAGSLRVRLQAAADASVLAGVKSGSADFAETRKVAERAFYGALGDTTGLSDISYKVVPIPDGIRADVAAHLTNAFTQVIGFKTTAVGASAQAVAGMSSIELAMVLDNTGSMASRNKLTELKAASRELLDTLERASGGRNTVKVSIVPFDTQVRVDVGTYRMAWWLRVRFPIERWFWSGYIQDRDQDYDVSDAAPESPKPQTLYPLALGFRSGDQLATLQPLTSDFAALRRTIDAMRPAGCTNVTIGASWGLATLSPSEPMPGAAAFDAPGVRKVMILLTDGDNTQNRWVDGCNHKGDTSLIDDRTRRACDTIKAQGVRLYAVRVIDGNAQLLRDCASPGDDGKPLYYDVKNAAELRPVFKSIGGDLVALRLTQ